MNNTYFEVSLLLIYGHGTNVLSTWSFVSCLCSVLYFFFFSYCCHTHSDGVGGYNTDSRVIVLVQIKLR